MDYPVQKEVLVNLNTKIPAAGCIVGLMAVKTVQKDKIVKHSTGPAVYRSPSAQLILTSV